MKKEIRNILKKYGITMSRNTLDEKFKALEDAGYEIGKNEKGWYLISDGITDGEMRILIDSMPRECRSVIFKIRFVKSTALKFHKD